MAPDSLPTLVDSSLKQARTEAMRYFIQSCRIPCFVSINSDSFRAVSICILLICSGIPHHIEYFSSVSLSLSVQFQCRFIELREDYRSAKIASRLTALAH